MTRRRLGRIREIVPAVMGDKDSGWAMPCVPCGLSNEIGSARPNVGTRVWIEFENGDVDYPIWGDQGPAGLHSVVVR